MKITLTTGHVIDSDGRQFVLQHTAGKFTVPTPHWSPVPPEGVENPKSEERPGKRGTTRRLYLHEQTRQVRSLTYSSLPDLARALAGFGVIQEHEAQRCWSVSSLVHRLVEQVEQVESLAGDSPTIEFGGGKFTIVPYSVGSGFRGFTLNAPRAGVVLANGGGGAVGHYPSLSQAFSAAADRVLKSSDVDIKYEDLNATYLALALSLFSDAVVKIGSVVHPLRVDDTCPVPTAA